MPCNRAGGTGRFDTGCFSPAPPSPFDFFSPFAFDSPFGALPSAFGAFFCFSSAIMLYLVTIVAVTKKLLSEYVSGALGKPFELHFAGRADQLALANSCPCVRLRIHEHHVRGIDRRFALRDATFLIALVRALVLELRVYAFDKHLIR